MVRLRFGVTIRIAAACQSRNGRTLQLSSNAPQEPKLVIASHFLAALPEVDNKTAPRHLLGNNGGEGSDVIIQQHCRTNLVYRVLFGLGPPGLPWFALVYFQASGRGVGAHCRGGAFIMGQHKGSLFG